MVSGFRRIAACEALDKKKILARILPSGAPDRQCAQIAISENAHQRTLNIVEQARSYALVLRFSHGIDDGLQMAEACGLPASRAALDRILPVTKMTTCLQEGILQEKIALPVAATISQFHSDDAEAMCNLLRTINTNLNIQREIVDTIFDISKRDGRSISQVIHQDAVSSLLENMKQPLPQRVRQLRKLLKRIRYPELCNAEERYGREVTSLGLDPCIQFHHPPYFEGGAYRLTMTFSSRFQLKHLLSESAKLADHPVLLPK